ncbi:outer dynein arm-docking complex subunit 3-like isoform 1-T1 [Synchiropus picturatus]
MAGTQDPHKHAQCEEMQRKIELLERDRTAEYETSQALLKKKKDNIRQLREENRKLYKKVIESDFDPSISRDKLVRKIMEKTNRLNAMKHRNKTWKSQLENMKKEYQRMKPKGNLGLPDDAMKLRDLDTRLKKTQLKIDEAEDLQTYYMKVKRHLQEESVCFQSQLDSLQDEITRDKKELTSLEIMNKKAQMAKDTVKAELQQQEELLSKERQERDNFIASYNRKIEERKARARRQAKKNQRGSAASDDMVTTWEEDKNTAVLETFQQIKEAIGVRDAEDLVQKFSSQKKTQEHLEKMKEESVKVLMYLKRRREQLLQQFEDMKNAEEADNSRELRSLEESEQNLLVEVQRFDAATDQRDKVFKILSTVRAGVRHIADKLQQVPLVQEVYPEVSSDSDQYVLVQMIQCEMKLKLLQGELEGEDEADILREMEEQKFFMKVEEDLPDENTRARLPDDETLEIHEEEVESDEEDANIVTKEELKNRSNQIIEAKSQIKHRSTNEVGISRYLGGEALEDHLSGVKNTGDK